MDLELPRQPESPAAGSVRDRAIGVIAIGTVLALLYLGRDVWVPITLAVILSLLIAPLVRVLRRVGLGQTGSVLGAVLLLAVVVVAIGGMIAVQVAKVAASMPQYEDRIRQKAAALDAVTSARLMELSAPAEHLAAEPGGRSFPSGAPLLFSGALAPVQPVPVEIRPAAVSSLQRMQRLVGSVWIPLETAGIVLVVLVFVLLEREAVRDRFIRIAGIADIRSTTLALNDAGERLSRFFVSQFLVNATLGCAVAGGLAIIGLPQAMLLGVLAAVLRFVPYVGIWIAALFAVLLAAGVDPGWSSAVYTVCFFLAVELIAGQLVEPQLYGHATGLSPLSVVISAIFWSWLWGPIGLIVSTPLTLCLVVAGRHIKALSILDVLLGDHQALTMPQRFYQRALAADSDEIINSAREYLKRNSLASYCDVVLVPALSLMRLEARTGTITAEKQAQVRSVMLSAVAAIVGGPRTTMRRPRGSVLDSTTLGRQLRSEREKISGPFQGPLKVEPGSVILCVGLGGPGDDLATELLVRILRDQKVDARHLTADEVKGSPPPEASPKAVALFFLVSLFPSDARSRAPEVAARARAAHQGAHLITMFMPEVLSDQPSGMDHLAGADQAVTTFGEAVQVCLSLQLQKLIETGGFHD